MKRRQPEIGQLAELQDAETSRSEWEERVEQRTAVLLAVNRELRREIVRRAAVESALREEQGRCHVLAHELNQPLSAISNYAQLCGHRLGRCRAKDGEELRDAIEQIAAQAHRASEIIGRLRQFVGRAKSPRLAADLNELVHNVAALLQVEIRRQGVRLELALDQSLPKASVDRIQIEQVITNLMSNAIDAVCDVPKDSRTVTIRTTRRPENLLELSVTDVGRGLPTDDISRLFEPFYTTKPGGMGLGLSISRSIVEAHGGRIEAAPRPAGGAIFRFTLPEGEGGEP